MSISHLTLYNKLAESHTKTALYYFTVLIHKLHRNFDENSWIFCA